MQLTGQASSHVFLMTLPNGTVWSWINYLTPQIKCTSFLSFKVEIMLSTLQGAVEGITWDNVGKVTSTYYCFRYCCYFMTTILLLQQQLLLLLLIHYVGKETKSLDRLVHLIKIILLVSRRTGIWKWIFLTDSKSFPVYNIILCQEQTKSSTLF